MCPDVSTTKFVTKSELLTIQAETITDLFSYFVYNVYVSAVNEAGRGNEANITERTLEKGKY